MAGEEEMDPYDFDEFVTRERQVQKQQQLSTSASAGLESHMTKKKNRRMMKGKEKEVGMKEERGKKRRLSDKGGTLHAGKENKIHKGGDGGTGEKVVESSRTLDRDTDDLLDSFEVAMFGSKKEEEVFGVDEEDGAEERRGREAAGLQTLIANEDKPKTPEPITKPISKSSSSSRKKKKKSIGSSASDDGRGQSGGQKRKVTFADRYELKFYEPDVTSKEDRGADAIEWGDEVEFALDGLQCDSKSSSSSKVALQSALQLVGLCSTATHKGFVKADADSRENFTNAATYLASDDFSTAKNSEIGCDQEATFALCSSLILHNLMAEPLWRLSTDEIRRVFATLHLLMQRTAKNMSRHHRSSTDKEDLVKSYTVLKSLSKAITIDRELPTSCQKSLLPLMVSLLILSKRLKAPETVEDSQEHEALKAQLLENGILEDLIQVVTACQSICTEVEGGDIDTYVCSQLNTQMFWIFNNTLKILASATFLNEQNVQYIETSAVTLGEGKNVKISMPTRLLNIVEEQYKNGGMASSECVHSSFNVLLNLTHESKTSCQILRKNTDFCSFARIIADFHYSAHHEKASSDLVNLVLGLLINMAEKDSGTREKLCLLKLSQFSQQEDAQIKGISKDFVDFLIIVANLGPKKATKEGQSNQQELNEDCVEVTVDMLSTAPKKDKSIAQTYASILLAFLVADDGALRKRVARLLDDGFTLRPLINAVKSFLDFLNFANALTEKQSEVLNGLISRLIKS